MKKIVTSLGILSSLVSCFLAAEINNEWDDQNDVENEFVDEIADVSDEFDWDSELLSAQTDQDTMVIAGQPSSVVIGMYSPNKNVSTLQIGATYSYVSLQPQGTSSFHGNLYGALGLYEYRPTNNIYGAAKVVWRQGHTHGSSGKRDLLYIDAQERLGYTMASEGNRWLLTLFSGFGYHRMNHHLKQNGEESIRFKYNEFYVPVGLLTNYDCNSWFSWGLGFTWMPQVFPTVSTSSQDGANWSLSYTLANFYVEMPFTFAVTQDRRFRITFNPFYEKWKDGHSTARTPTGTNLDLPGNNYNFWGADLNFGYSF